MDYRLIILLTFIASVFYFLLLRPNLAAGAQLRRWAHENHLLLLKAERRYLAQGPFTLRHKSGIVFKLEVQAAIGGTKTGWVRFAYDLWRREKWSSVVMWDDTESKND